MKKVFVYFSVIFSLFILSSRISVHAQTTEEFERAEVLSIDKEGTIDSFGIKLKFQDLILQIISGSDIGKKIKLENGGQSLITDNQLVKKGDILILDKTPNGYLITDKYRLDAIPFLLVGLVVLLILVAGKKGIGSVLGLIISLIIILGFIIPQILAGGNPLIIAILGSFVILIVSTFLAHGVSRQTTIALISTFLALIIASILAYFAVHFASLAGIGDEEAVSLLMGTKTSNINLQGLLLAGIIIGTLGALNDITTTQSATIFELKETNKNLTFEELIKKGSRVGKEHIVSLVNTLVLAYAGSALAIFIYFVENPGNQPLWVVLNNEIIIDEIVRTIAGTCGLILAIPICTYLASWWTTRKKKTVIKTIVPPVAKFK